MEDFETQKIDNTKKKAPKPAKWASSAVTPISDLHEYIHAVESLVGYHKQVTYNQQRQTENK